MVLSNILTNPLFQAGQRHTCFACWFSSAGQNTEWSFLVFEERQTFDPGLVLFCSTDMVRDDGEKYTARR